ncbi:MAG TPA: hypothetical protein VK623_10345 [Flavobacterium sp.]|nr:hypothetical protein [Flavobacterium sp.]
MRKLIILFSLLAVVGCKSKKPTTAKPAEGKITKVMPEKVNQEQKDKAYQLGTRVLMACNTSRFKPFSPTEATPDVIKNATEEKLTKICHNFQLKYGDFKGVTFMEVVHDRKNKTNIYRFKANYEKKIANKELRVTMNEKDQATAIKSLDWVDKYK